MFTIQLPSQRGVKLPPLWGLGKSEYDPPYDGLIYARSLTVLYPVAKPSNPTPAQTTAYNNHESALAVFKQADIPYQNALRIYTENRKAYDQTMNQINNIFSVANQAAGGTNQVEKERTAKEYDKAINNLLMWQWDEKRGTARPTASNSSVNPNKKTLYELFADIDGPMAARNEAARKVNITLGPIAEANSRAAAAAAAAAKNAADKAAAEAAKKKADDEAAALKKLQNEQAALTAAASGPNTSSGPTKMPTSAQEQQAIMSAGPALSGSTISSVKNAAKIVRNGVNAAKLKYNIDNLVTRIQQLGGSRKNTRPGKKARRVKSRRVKSRRVKSRRNVYY